MRKIEKKKIGVIISKPLTKELTQRSTITFINNTSFYLSRQSVKQKIE